jgi:putative membrane protein
LIRIGDDSELAVSVNDNPQHGLQCWPVPAYRRCRSGVAVTYILFRYLHFIAIAVLAGALVIENLAISRSITGEDARNLARVDAVYGASAVFVFLFGLTLWLWTGKPAAFYNANPLFHWKLGLFVLIAILSIYPTVFLVGHRASQRATIEVPPPVIWLMRAELCLLVVLPVLAVLMARGVGLN